eukprot:1474510-Amphidinium_carterae.1
MFSHALQYFATSSTLKGDCTVTSLRRVVAMLIVAGNPQWVMHHTSETTFVKCSMSRQCDLASGVVRGSLWFPDMVSCANCSDDSGKAKHDARLGIKVSNTLAATFYSFRESHGLENDNLWVPFR